MGSFANSLRVRSDSAEPVRAAVAGALEGSAPRAAWPSVYGHRNGVSDSALTLDASMGSGFPRPLFQEADEGRPEPAGGESSHPARASFRLPHHGGAGVVEEALAVLPRLPRWVRRHRGAAV